jgi:hypothetical protein
MRRLLPPFLLFRTVNNPADETSRRGGLQCLEQEYGKRLADIDA